MRVRLGSERLLDSPASTAAASASSAIPPRSTDGSRHVADRLAAHPRARLAAIFGPQHGFRSDVQDNMIETRHGAATTIRRVPVLLALQRDARADRRDAARRRRARHRPAGRRRRASTPTSTRWPTACGAARRHGVKVIVCDRPNPIGGVAVEGPMLVPGFESFVGQYPIPMRHGMTIGELARLFNDAVRHRRRPRGDPDGGLAPRHVLRRDRPAVGDAVAEHADARHARSSIRARCSSRARTCRKGAARRGRSSSSARRGSTAERFADAMNRLELPGAFFRPAVFEPTFQKHARETLRRLPDSRARSRSAFRPVETGVALIAAFRASGPGRFALARAALRIRARQAADRHPGGIVRAARADRARGSRRARSRASWEPDGRAPFRADPREVPALLKRL